MVSHISLETIVFSGCTTNLVCCFMLTYIQMLRPQGTFYLTLFNDLVRTKYQSRDEFQRKIKQCYHRDVLTLQKLGYDST